VGGMPLAKIDSMTRWNVYLGGGLLTLFLLGVGVGWWSAARQASETGMDGSRLEGLSAPGTELARLSQEAEGAGSPPGAANRALLEALAASDDSLPQASLLRLMARFSPNPEAMVTMIIDSMSEKELALSLASFSQISPEKLQEISDPKAFTRRLAELAMQDLFNVGGDAQPAPQNVLFSETGSDADLGSQVFPTLPGEGRIRATFPMEGYRGDEVFVKWVRLDDPKIILFNHYPIRSEAEFNYVWLEPSEGWEKGEYQVNFYTADESLSPLSGGRYLID
jgi:hypothetical protein